VHTLKKLTRIQTVLAVIKYVIHHSNTLLHAKKSKHIY